MTGIEGRDRLLLQSTIRDLLGKVEFKGTRIIDEVRGKGVNVFNSLSRRNFYYRVNIGTPKVSVNVYRSFYLELNPTSIGRFPGGRWGSG